MLFVLVTGHPLPPGDSISHSVVAGDTRNVSAVV